MNAPVEAGLAPYVLADSQDGVCTLTLNRGERFNPLSRAMIAALNRSRTRPSGLARLRLARSLIRRPPPGSARRSRAGRRSP